MTTGHKPHNEAPGVPAVSAPAQSAAEAAQNLERTLEHFESMLAAIEGQVQGSATAGAQVDSQAAGELAGLRRTVDDILERLDRTIDRLVEQTDRLTRASDLVAAAKRVEGHMDEIAEAFQAVAAQRRQQAPTPAPEAEPRPAAPSEPQFQPGEAPLHVVLAAVPGFQGLMDAQRALSGLPQTESASVVAFKNGEASIEVVLSAPAGVRQIVDRLCTGTGEQLLIEESRPEVGRLRLRFIEQGNGAPE